MMSLKNISRRNFSSGVLKGAFSIPFALSPLAREVQAQTAQSDRPLRFISITLPFSPRTETTDGSNGDDNFIRLMWDQFPESARPYTRFFSNFSYNIEDGFWHGMAGFSYLLTCNPISTDRTIPSDHPHTVSLDYEIARLMGSHYSPYANMQANANDPIQNSAMPMTLMSHKPYWGEYTGSDSVYYAPTTGAGQFDGNANYGCFLTYRPNGTVKNPLYPGNENTYSSIFGIQNSHTGPLPETGLEQVFRLIHNTDVANFITQKQIQETEQSHQKMLDLQARIEKHQNYLSAQRAQPTGGCVQSEVSWPGVNANHNDLNQYNLEAIKQVINCDLHRVINFSFTDSEATGVTTIDANGLNGTNIPGHSDIDFHNATHREIGGQALNNQRMKSIYEYYYRQIGTLINDLQNMDDPLAPGTGQNVLDNTIIYITGSNGFPGVHSANNMAIAIVGGGKHLASGEHLLPKLGNNADGDYSAHVFDGSDAYTGSTVPSYAGHDKVANLHLSLLKLFGSDRTSWGSEGGRVFSDARSNSDRDLINFSTPGRHTTYRG